MASRIPRIACPDPAPPRSRREEVGSLARVYARFAPNFGRGPEARRVRQTSPPDAGRNPVAGRKWINSGRKRAAYNLGGPPLWNFATACQAGGPHAAREYWIAGAVR